MKVNIGLRRVEILRDADGVPGGPPPGDNAPPPQAPPADNLISLTRDEYANMVGALTSMQAKLEGLENANRQPDPPAPTTDDIDRLTNTQLLSLVQSQIGQPILNAVMQLAVKEELREVQEAHPDFKTMKEEVYKEAQSNTQLSLEQAYLIVKARKTGQAPPPVMPPVASPIVPPTPPPGQKPGITPSSLDNTGGMSIKDAAAAALKTLQLES